MNSYYREELNIQGIFKINETKLYEVIVSRLIFSRAIAETAGKQECIKYGKISKKFVLLIEFQID